MMDISGIWEGTLDGTNWGRLIAKIDHRASVISGMAQVIEIGGLTYDFSIEGKEQDNVIYLHLSSSRYAMAEYSSRISVHVNSFLVNNIGGEWKSDIGTFGTFRAERQTTVQKNIDEVVQQRSDANAAFIIMAFNDLRAGLLPVVDIMDAIKRACEAAGVKARRVDEFEHSGSITSLLLDQIKIHRFLISDLTHERPNVYYEVGYAHGLGKEVILTAQAGAAVHFDISGYNIIYYNSITGLCNRIVKRLRARMTEEERAQTDARMNGDAG